jgi:hypothetical protein
MMKREHDGVYLIYGRTIIRGDKPCVCCFHMVRECTLKTSFRFIYAVVQCGRGR